MGCIYSHALSLVFENKSEAEDLMISFLFFFWNGVDTLSWQCLDETVLKFFIGGLDDILD